MQILIEFIIDTIVVISCTSHELLEKERTFPCTSAISEAMRQNCTRRLRTNYNDYGVIFMCYKCNEPFHFITIPGDGCKIPGPL